MRSQKGSTTVFIVAGVLLIAAIGGALYLGKSQLTKQRVTTAPQATPTAYSSEDTISWNEYKGEGFTFKYPTNWIKDEDEPGLIYIYDPGVMYEEEVNGGFMIKLPTHFLKILSAERTNKIAKQSANEFINGWKEQIPELDLKRESYKENGIDYEIYDNYGEAERGKIIDISNGRMLVSINSSQEHFKDTSVEAKILSTFKLTN